MFVQLPCTGAEQRFACLHEEAWTVTPLTSVPRLQLIMRLVIEMRMHLCVVLLLPIDFLFPSQNHLGFGRVRFGHGSIRSRTRVAKTFGIKLQ
jgi:hypothetical protein